MAQATGYSRTHIILHWAIAVLVLFQLLVHEGMEYAWAERAGRVVGDSNPFPHIIVGVAILILAVWRVILRLRNGAPPHPAGQPRALAMLASIVHGLFYALLFIMPLTGMIAWFGHVEGAALAHITIQLAFLPLIALHVVGALVQQFYFGTGVITRMTGPDATP